LERFLVAAGVVLSGHENEPRTRFRALLLRRSAKGMENANDCDISRDHADSDREDYGDAENQRHEERDQDQPPCQEFNIRCRNPNLRIATKRGFFNLPALKPGASDDQDAP
jgi:hypothetical protein